jgi:CRISPR system Cascade subunit CasC
MYIELHMIQNFAPSNLNRDDTNNPKDCEFGGVRRARISSQCIKRAMRHEPIFTETTGVEPSTRTRWITDHLSKPLLRAGKPEDEVTEVVTAFAGAYAGKMDRKQEGRTSVLLYLSEDEVQYIINQLITDWDASLAEAQKKSNSFKDMVKEMVKQTRDRTSAPDIALFGRMLANDPKLNIDAACQVAHALSTHAVTMDMDFFTAVDDLQPDEEAGAGMMGMVGFNSACFYRYARISWDQLVQNLDGDVEMARRTVEGFLRAADRAVPTGKQNSFAAQNPPSFSLAVVRRDGMSWSLANAFEKPVRAARTGGLVEPSIQALDAYWGRFVANYGADDLVKVAARSLEPVKIKALQDAMIPNFNDWVTAVIKALPSEEAMPA